MKQSEKLDKIEANIKNKYPKIDEEKLKETAKWVLESCQHIYIHLDRIRLHSKKSKSGKQ